ncbi:hypothetical protein [Sphingobium sp. SYK-6]|uniref:hypothetical protein n=1 Tax=Sphingobium sp. (strain NBRC 103272 / SYK-6) TaxID=627192 RepID=UPI0002D8C89C|nr:hypothetical protein [Sphingobium sp. SYK-6]
MPLKSFGLAPLILATLMAGCGSQQQDPANDMAENGMTRNAANAADVAGPGAAGNSAGAAGGMLVPPAPGEEGGLPDDRTPLNESAARNPASVEASGATIELWGLAIGEGRYGDAYRLWSEDGRQSGMTEADFADSYRKYSEFHVLVGRPQTGGTVTARVPVQAYGRLRENGAPFNLIGTMTLVRNPDGQKGEPGERPWLIGDSDLRPRGTVRVVPAGADATAARIPVAFQGRWASSREACGRADDESRLAIAADRLSFHESSGMVRSVQMLSPDSVRITADFTGEGEQWTRTLTLGLGADGQSLDIADSRRVRCGNA